MTTEELDAGWFKHLVPNVPMVQSSEARFDSLFESVLQLECKIESLYQVVEGVANRAEARFKKIEARLPPDQAVPMQAKRHDTPLFSYPP